MSLAQRASRHNGRRRPRSWPSLTVMLVAGLTAALVGGVGVTAGAVVNPNPTFSNPTSVTNPLFPQSRLEQVITLGVETGEPLRYELTRLPGTKTITVNGKAVQALKVQFLATSDSAVLEVADDYFAQADDGTVWYLGEHVSNYEDGVLTDNDGTWVSGEKRPDGKRSDRTASCTSPARWYWASHRSATSTTPRTTSPSCSSRSPSSRPA